MQEARLVMPKADNDGNELDLLHDQLATRLCEEFGGFTATDTRGGWIDESDGRLYREPGIAYDVAMEAIEDNDETLRLIAAEYCRRSAQICMYVRLASGSVEFITESYARIE